MSERFNGAAARYIRVEGEWYVCKAYMAHQMQIAIDSAYKDGLRQARRIRNDTIIGMIRRGGQTYRQIALEAGCSIRTVTGIAGRAKQMEMAAAMEPAE